MVFWFHATFPRTPNFSNAPGGFEGSWWPDDTFQWRVQRLKLWGCHRQTTAGLRSNLDAAWLVLSRFYSWWFFTNPFGSNKYAEVVKQIGCSSCSPIFGVNISHILESFHQFHHLVFYVSLFFLGFLSHHVTFTGPFLWCWLVVGAQLCPPWN